MIHYTAGRGDVRGVGRVFRSRPASATFAVDRAGDIGQYVAAEDAAWHAGDGLLPSAADFDAFEGRPVPLIAGVGDINRRSVGIELCNRGWAPGGSNPYVTARHRNPAARSTSWESYTKAQYQGLRSLIPPLLRRFPRLRYVTGHEDVTHRDTIGRPGGKQDPGPAFDWQQLAGFGLDRVWYDFDARAWCRGQL
ncbi:MAG: N-acetylmuramoyl-L-alanine amidase [Deltaproteobacteria bacterium]|nr:N-acetylmuramoyl-L-alanine amidase [Deltaproteobacteria bacterium]